MYLSFLFIKLP